MVSTCINLYSRCTDLPTVALKFSAHPFLFSAPVCSGSPRKPLACMPSWPRLLVALIAFGSMPFLLQAQSTELPWLSTIDPDNQRATLHTVSTTADVTVSDGLTYTTHSVYHDPQRLIFSLVYPDRTVTQGVEGRYFWTFDGTAETEGTPFTEIFARGHQFHAQVLFFDDLFPNRLASMPDQFEGQDCMMLASADEGPTTKLYYATDGLPLGMELLLPDNAPIRFRFEDWQTIDGLMLPFGVWIDDGQRTFQYRYTAVRLNEGSLDDLRTPAHLLTDEQQLLRLHRITMDDHLFGETAGIKASLSDTMLVVSEGDVYRTDSTQTGAMLDRLIATRDYTHYDDLIRPIVKVSEDGTLGWVIAQVSARGARFDANGAPGSSLSFVSAWVSLYEKIDGQWRHTGNVSTFQPEQP